MFPYWFSVWMIYPLIRSSTIIVLAPIFPLMCVNICFIYVSTPMLGAYIFIIIIFLVGFTLLSLHNIPLCFFLQFCFKVHFALLHQLFFVPFHLGEISFHFQSACVFRSEMNLFCSASIHVFFFWFTHPPYIFWLDHLVHFHLKSLVTGMHLLLFCSMFSDSFIVLLCYFLLLLCNLMIIFIVIFEFLSLVNVCISQNFGLWLPLSVCVQYNLMFLCVYPFLCRWFYCCCLTTFILAL